MPDVKHECYGKLSVKSVLKHTINTMLYAVISPVEKSILLQKEVKEFLGIFNRIVRN